MFKYKINISKSSMNKVMEYIEGEVKKSCVEASKETAEKGAEFANKQYAKAFYEGVHDAVASVEQINQYAYAIVARGNSVPWIEWGYGKGRPDVDRSKNKMMRYVDGKPVWWFKSAGDVQDASPAWSYHRGDKNRPPSYYYITKNGNKRWIGRDEVFFENDDPSRPYALMGGYGHDYNPDDPEYKSESRGRRRDPYRKQLMISEHKPEYVDRDNVYVASGARAFHVMAHTRAYAAEIFPKITKEKLAKLK